MRTLFVFLSFFMMSGSYSFADQLKPAANSGNDFGKYTIKKIDLPKTIKCDYVTSSGPHIRLVSNRDSYILWCIIGGYDTVMYWREGEAPQDISKEFRTQFGENCKIQRDHKLNERDEFIFTGMCTYDTYYSYLWRPGRKISKIPSPYYQEEMIADSINNRGEVVGRYLLADGSVKSFYWSESTGTKELRFSISNGYSFFKIESINDKGILFGNLWKGTVEEPTDPLPSMSKNLATLESISVPERFSQVLSQDDFGNTLGYCQYEDNGVYLKLCILNQENLFPQTANAYLMYYQPRQNVYVGMFDYGGPTTASFSVMVSTGVRSVPLYSVIQGSNPFSSLQVLIGRIPRTDGGIIGRGFVKKVTESGEVESELAYFKAMPL